MAKGKKKPKAAPVGDSTHTPRWRQTIVRPDPTGNRRDRREAAKVAKKEQKKLRKQQKKG